MPLHFKGLIANNNQDISDDGDDDDDIFVTVTQQLQ